MSAVQHPRNAGARQVSAHNVARKEMPAYRVLRKDRASRPDLCPEVGEFAYFGGCDYGCADEDSRATGIEHISAAAAPDAPFFTIPREDLERLPPNGGGKV